MMYVRRPKTYAEGHCCLRRSPALSASGKTIGFGAAVPRPARSRAYASPHVFPRTAQGSLPARVGSPLAGRDSHLLDDARSFMVASHPPIPFDPQGLVALEILSAGRARRLAWAVARGGRRRVGAQGECSNAADVLSPYGLSHWCAHVAPGFRAL
jgi:hypothetical protein